MQPISIHWHFNFKTGSQAQAQACFATCLQRLELEFEQVEWRQTPENLELQLHAVQRVSETTNWNDALMMTLERMPKISRSVNIVGFRSTCVTVLGGYPSLAELEQCRAVLNRL